MPNLYRASSSGGVVRLADNAHIPNDGGNKDWNDYQAYVAGGGLTDAEPTVDLATYKALAVKRVNENAAAQRLSVMPAGAAGDGGEVWLMLRFEQAVACAADGTPTAPEYPLLAAEIPETGANVAAIATAVLAEKTQLATDLAAIEDVRATTVAAVNAAANAAAVDAIIAGLVWP